MIDIKATEQKISAALDPATLVATYGCPAYKLRAFPGELEELGKPINCNHVQVKFSNIQYDKYTDLKFSQKCITQINEVYFNILIQNNNLRSHTDVYEIATAVILELRGSCLLTNLQQDIIQGQSPAQITDYTFKKVANGGACYQSEISLMNYFTDVYKAKSC